MMSQRLCQCLIGSSDGYIQYKSAVRVFSTGASSNEQLSIAEYNANNTSIANSRYLFGTRVAEEAISRQGSLACLPPCHEIACHVAALTLSL